MWLQCKGCIGGDYMIIATELHYHDNKLNAIGIEDNGVKRVVSLNEVRNLNVCNIRCDGDKLDITGRLKVYSNDRKIPQ